MADDNPNNQVENNGKELVRNEQGQVISGVLNPNGRPKKGHSITETIRSMMDEKPEIKKALAAKILQLAADGDITAMKTIWNYIDGMPKMSQQVEVTYPTPLLGANVPNNNSSQEATSTE